MMRRLAVTLGLTATIGLGGCGGGSEKAATTTVAPTTLAPTTTLLRGSDQASTKFCMLAKTYSEKSDALAAAVSDPAKLKVAATDAETAIRQAQEVAPATIKTAVTTVARTAADVLASLKKNNYVLGQAELAKVQDPSFLASFSVLTTYGREHCGVG